MPLFKRALSEFVFERLMLKHYTASLLYEYIGFSVTGQQVAVRILSYPLKSY